MTKFEVGQVLKYKTPSKSRYKIIAIDRDNVTVRVLYEDEYLSMLARGDVLVEGIKLLNKHCEVDYSYDLKNDIEGLIK